VKNPKAQVLGFWNKISKKLFAV